MEFNKRKGELHGDALQRCYQVEAQKTKHLRPSGKTMLEEIKELCPNVTIPLGLCSIINRAVRTHNHIGGNRVKIDWTSDPTMMDMESIWYNTNVEYNTCETAEQIAYFLNNQ